MSPEDKNDPWATETLAPVKNAEITVMDSYFEDAKFGIQLTMVCRVDIPHDPIDFPGESFNIWYSVGKKGWAVLDNGMRIAKPESSSDQPKIHANSKYGMLINRVVKDLEYDMRPKGMPTEASVWKGMRFHMVSETIHYEGLEAREGQTLPEGKTTIDVDSAVLLPIAILPEDGSSLVQAPTPISAAPSASAQAAPAPATNGTGSPEDYLKSVIAGKSSVVEAKTAAMRDARITGDDKLTASILEGSLIEKWMQEGVITLVDDKIAVTT